MGDVAAAAGPELRVVMVPSPGHGHLIPFVELAKRLLHRHSFSVTIMVPDNGTGMKPQRDLLQSLPATISPHFLPPVSLSDVPADANVITRVTLTMIRSLPAIRTSLKTLLTPSAAGGGRVVAVVVDFLSAHALHVAAELGVPPYVFYTCGAFHLTLGLKAPELEETCPGELRDLPEPLELPGCIPLSGRDLPEPFLDKKNDAYKWMVEVHKEIATNAVGIMVNGFVDLESGIFKALAEERGRTGSGPLIYPIGPVPRLESDDPTEMGTVSIECLKWLDKQPEDSVLFISFGSGGKLSKVQQDEIAFGLEMSGKRFIWVVKPPGDYMIEKSIESSNNPSSYLPDGFLERTKGVGLVIPGWAPQVRILGHGSTGGFMSHCGWNSSLESIVNGVPIIAWPNHAEQRMNAAFLAGDAKIALRMDTSEKNGIVGREDIAGFVKAVLDGEEGKLLRSNVKELKAAAANAIGSDGSSTKSLDEVAKLWMKQS
ncbi:unnamed protein product [Linum trigynum]|uniref:Glycosyltransferase n=1 Tax=Linum trigynum TaxID=586398 RepID=A0AAV2DHY1_9ROSI